MLYINDRDVKALEVNWHELIDVVLGAAKSIQNIDYAQPLKVYLRYGKRANRIIAMPAYVSLPNPAVGMKWIASFPGNVDRGLDRAHSVSIINNVETGAPCAVINTARISVMRTASVSGALLKKIFDTRKGWASLCIAIIGFGPIGRAHFDICESLFPSRIAEYVIYDKREQVDLKKFADRLESGRMCFASSWEDAFRKADIVITCTAGTARYIDERPKDGGVYLNVSLRDYCLSFISSCSTVIVDDWEEVCREDTDIHREHLADFISEKDSLNLVSVLHGDCDNELSIDRSISFNPMGMATFDIAVGAFFFEKSRKLGIGTELE